MMKLTLLIAGILFGLTACGNSEVGTKAIKAVVESCKGKTSMEARVSQWNTELIVHCDDATITKP